MNEVKLSLTERKILLSASTKKINHAANICRGICTKSYGLIVLGKLKKKGLIRYEYVGKFKKINLTKKGLELLKQLTKKMDAFSNGNKDNSI